MALGLNASVISISGPSPATEIGARIRWGGTGFEAAIVDSNPFDPNPGLNPPGSPAWQTGLPYNFEISYEGSTGALGVRIDFDRNNTFGAGESITRSTFGGSTTSYAGLGFQYLSISGNESSSTARSTITDLSINGSNQSSISPGGSFVEFLFADSSGASMDSITITGKLTFTTSGTSQERPSWNFNFKGPASASVPDSGTTLAMMGLALTGFAWARRQAAS